MRNLAAVLTLLCVAAVQAQPSCPTSAVDPGGILLEKSCEPCLGGQPVTFTLVPKPNTCPHPYWCPTPYTVQPCDKVVWNFGDNSGETTVIGSPSVTHTYAARNGYRVSVTVTNSLSPASTPNTFELLVGGNPPTTLIIGAPPAVSEASPNLLVSLTRSGNLDVPTAATYEISQSGGFTPRINATAGQVAFAPGESQKTLSFPLINNDAAYTGPASYRLEVGSSDGTLLTGLQPAPSPFERAGFINTVDDEQQPHLRSDDVVIREGTGKAPTFARLTATLDAPLGRRYDVWTTVNEAGYGDLLPNQGAPPSFGFAPGQMMATTDIAIYADAEPEPDEKLVLTLPAIYGVDPYGPLYDRPSMTVTIVNDDIGFGQYELRTTVGETLIFPIDIGNPLAAAETLTVTAADPKVVSVTASVPIGASKGQVMLTGLLGAHTRVVAELMRPAGPARGEVDVTVFQPSILVASPEAVRLRAGEEATLRVSLSPAQGEATPIIVQSSSTGIVAVASTLVTAPAGGDAVVTLHGVAPGKATLNIFSLGQPHSIVVPVEVLPNSGRRRSARP